MYPKHISSPATYPDEAIGSYLQLKNLITLLGRPGAAYVCEPAISFGEDTSATGIRIPGLEEVRLGEHRGSGVYRIRDSEAIGKTSLIAFSKMNAEPEPPSMKAAEMDAAVAEAWKRNEILVLDNRENRITALRIVAGKDVKEPALEERIMGSLKEWLRFDPNYLKYVSFIESMTRLGKLPDMHYVLSDNNSVEAIAVCASGDENQLRLMEIAPWNKRTLWEKRRFTGVGHQLFAYVMNEMTKDGKRVNIFVPDPYLKDILREAGVGLKDRYDSEDAKKLLASQEVLIAQLSSPAVSAGAIGTKPGPPSMVGQAAPPAQARERMLERTRRAPRGIIDWRAAAYATELYGERARGFYNRFYNPETGKGVIIDLIRKRKEESDRHLRVWSCGSSYGLELLTLVWLTRQALEASNEWPKNWKLEFVGTDEVADVLDEAERRAELRKAAYREGGEWVEVPLDTEGFDIRFLILDHFQQDQRRDWETWQREEKGFDIVFMRGTVTAAGAEEWAMSLVRDDGFFFGDKFVIDGKGHMVFAPAPEPPSMKAAENTVLAAVAPSDVTVRDLRVKAVGFLKQFPNQRRLKDIIKAIEKRGGWATLSEIAQNLGIKTTGAVTTSDVFGVEAVEKGMPYLDELFRNINIIQVSKGRPQIEKPVAKKTKDAVTAFIAALKTLGGRASGEEMQSALGISGTAVSHYKKLIDFGRLNYNRRLADAFPLSQIMDSRMKITQDKILRALELVGGISTVSELTMLTGMKGPDVTRALKGIDFAQINAYRRTMHLFELEVRGKDTSNERYEAGMTKEAYRSIARRRKDYRRRFGIKYVSRSFERAASMIFARAFWPMVKRVPSGRDIYIESHLNFSDALDAIIDAAYRNRIYAERMKPDGRRTCSMALAEFFAIIVPRVLNNTAVMVSLRRGDIATFESALEDAWKRYKYVEANPGKEKPDGFDKTAFMFNKSIYPKDADEAIRIVRMRYRGTAPAAAEAQPQPPSEFGRVPDVMMFALGAALVSALIFTPVLLSCLGTVDMRFVMGALGAGFAAIAGIVLSLTTEGTGEYTPRPYLLKAARWAKRIEVEDRHLKIADEILKKFEADPKKRFLFGNEFGNAWTTPDKYAVILALERLAHRKPEELRKRVGTAVKVATPQGRLDHLSRIIIEHILAYLRKHKWRMPEKPKNLRDFNAFPSAERLMKEMGLTISAWGKYAKKEKIFGHLKRHYLLSRLSEHQQELVRQIVAWRRELGDLLGEKRSAGRDPDKMLGYLEEKGMVVLNADSDLVDDISGLLKDLELQEKRDIGTFCAFLANIPPLPERYVEALTARARKTSEGVSVLEKTAAQPPSMKAAESALNMRALALQDALSHEIAKSPAVEMRAGSNIIPCILSTDGENLIIGGRSINIAPSAQGIAENQELKALLREPIHILVPPGTFGRMVVSVVFENNEPVFLVEEIQPSVGYRDLVSDRKNIRKYARWVSVLVDRVYDIAAKVGINKVYVISPEKAARNVALDNDSGVPVSQAQLDHCYRAPFKNRWEIRQISYIKPLRDSVMAVNSSVWARKPAEPPSMKAAEEESRVSPNRTSAKTKTLDKLTDETALDSFKVLLLKALKFFHPELTEKTLNLEAIGRMLSSVSDKENYILAVKAGKVVGYCHYILITNRNGLPYGLGDNLYVDPSERGAGIGSMLSRERFKALKEKGVGIFSSVVSANDESQEFHKDFIARNRSAVMDIEYEKKTLTGYRVDIERYFNVGDTRQEPSMKAEGSGQEERPGYQDIGVSGRGDQGIGVSGKEKSQPPSMKAAESREHIKKASVETPAFHPPHPGFNPGIPDNLDAWSKIARDVNALSAAGSAPASSKPVAEPYSEPSSMVAATSGTGPILNLKASLKDMHNKVIYPYLQSNPLPEGSKIFVSSDLLDPDDVTGLNSVSNHLEVLSPEQIIREATRNNGKVSKEKIAVIVSREEFNKWTEAQKTNNKASVIVLDSDLKGSNYTYLELLIAFTRAVMANEPNNINLFAKILFGESIPDNILNHLKDSNPIGFAIKAILKFKPAIPIDPKEIIDDYKKMVNGYLVMA
jgi:GNAT superfamily N-acetyltransferase